MVSALLSAGLRLERLVEYPYANGWRGFIDGAIEQGIIAARHASKMLGDTK